MRTKAALFLFLATVLVNPSGADECSSAGLLTTAIRPTVPTQFSYRDLYQDLYPPQKVFEVEVLLKRDYPSSQDHCVFEIGEQVLMVAKATNISSSFAYIARSDTFIWNIYIFEPGGWIPIRRLLDQITTFGDQDIFIPLQPGEFYLDAWNWRLGVFWYPDPLPPGTYDLVIALEGSSDPVPNFLVPDDERSEPVRFTLVEPGAGAR